MDTHLVLIQSKADYDEEQRQKALIFLKIIWWFIASFMFSFILKPLVTGEVYMWIFIGFLVLFATADLTTDRKIRSYIRAFLAVPYGIWGIAFLFEGFTSFKDSFSEGMIGFIIGGLLLRVSYKYLKKYTVFFGRQKRFKRKKSQFSFKKQIYFLIAFSLGIWLSQKILPYIDVTNKIIILILTGLIIETTTKIMQSIIWNNKFIVDRHFIFWVAIITASYFVANFTIDYIPQILSNPSLVPYFNILIMGLIITIIANIVWRSQIEHRIL